MNTNIWKIVAYTLIVIGFILFGFYIGRSSVEVKPPTTIIKYIKGDTIQDSIPYPEPYEVYKPIDTANIIKQCVKDGIYYELFPEKTVVEYIEPTKEDTMKILADWATKRLYSETLFDIDTVGKCVVNAEVQYNRMMLIGYSYIPVTKVVTIEKNNVHRFSPFIGCGMIIGQKGTDIMAYPNFEGGMFINETYGVKAQIGRDFINNWNIYGLSFLYKF